MRFLLDEHLPTGLATLIFELGSDALHVKTEGLLAASDNDLWSLAAGLSATVISKDRDFLALARRDRRRSSLVHMNLGNISNRDLYEAVRAAWPLLMERLESGDPVVELRAHD